MWLKSLFFLYQDYYKALEDADEKVQLANQIYDLVSRQKACCALSEFMSQGVQNILISAIVVLIVLLHQLQTDIFFLLERHLMFHWLLGIWLLVHCCKISRNNLRNCKLLMYSLSGCIWFWKGTTGKLFHLVTHAFWVLIIFTLHFLREQKSQLIALKYSRHKTNISCLVDSPSIH